MIVQRMMSFLRLAGLSVIATGAALTMREASADSVRLSNGDVIRGTVRGLSDQELTIESENFGEMKIPRQKVEIIALGDKPLEEMLPAAAPQAPTLTPQGGAGAIPSLQNPQVQQQLGRLMQEALGGGFGGIGTMQQDLGRTQQGLRELQQDLGPGPEADALDGYIKLFQLFGGGAGSGPAAGGAAPPATSSEDKDAQQ